ncbi:MAG: alpha-hydroxy-acid oxidizing protein, partial [Alphaproteobacteria bacterium]|nr:alpha-hydroxy-acid oxidizing protein [Alphaproteobacteria bacterium]
MNAFEDRTARWKLDYPTVADLRRRAERRTPKFAFEYVDGAAGAGDINMKTNAAALDAVEIVPRYGVENFAADISVELFGHRYNQPVGIAPMGIPSLVLPGGEKAFARAAKAHNIPLALGGVAGATVEDCAALAPDNIWFQLYRVAKDELAVNMDMANRAGAAGVHVLVLTLDVPARTKRPRELHARLMIPYKHSFRTVSEALKHPHWLAAYFRHGMHGFANYARYAGENPSLDDVTAFVRRESGGSFTWDEVKRFRDSWPGALVVKGLLHPADAERAVEVGADGVIVSNHGGRQLEAAPPAIDALPAVAEAVGGRTRVMFDSGVRAGIDVVRAMALGAEFVFSGRAFMYGLGALGEDGPGYVAEFFAEETAA